MEDELTVQRCIDYAYHIVQAQKYVIRYSQTLEGEKEDTRDYFLCLADILTDIKEYFIDKSGYDEIELYSL